MTWREEAKKLGVALYDHQLNKLRKKVDVLAEIEAKKNKSGGKTRVVITRQEAVNVCCAALKAHAASKGLDPEKEILISRWYLQMNRNNMTFVGTDKDEGTGTESIGAAESTEPTVSLVVSEAV